MNNLCMTSALSHGIVVSRIITQSVSDWPWNWHMYAIILLGHLLHYDCAGSIAVVPLLPGCVTTAFGWVHACRVGRDERHVGSLTHCLQLGWMEEAFDSHFQD